MSILNDTYVLSNGVNIPKLGLGTWQVSPEDAVRVVDFALNNGYKHIDTARNYGNSDAVGQGWKNSGIPREDFFLTTKVRAGSKSYEAAKQDIEDELENLQTDYIDLVIIHCPQPWDQFERFGTENRFFEENLEVWRCMEEYYEAGKIKAIGVSNFNTVDLENLVENAKIKPMVNQISYRIGYTEDEIVEYCEDNDILVEAFSPLGTGEILDNKDIKKVADKYDKSVAQIAIRYVLEHGHVVLAKSVHEEYILENAQVDFEISDEDMAYLDSLDTSKKN